MNTSLPCLQYRMRAGTIEQGDTGFQMIFESSVATAIAAIASNRQSPSIFTTGALFVR